MRVRQVSSVFACFLVLALPAVAQTRIERELDLAPGGRLEIDTTNGNIDLRGTSTSGVHIVVESREELAEHYDLRFESVDGLAKIRVERKGRRSWFGGWGNVHRDRLKITVETPRRVDLELDTSGGSISVDGIEGRVRADTSGGSIGVDDVRGDVRLGTSGGSIDVQRIEGELTAETSGGPISVTAVSGNLAVETSGGSITIVEAGGRVQADTSGGSIDVGFAAGNSRGGNLSTSGGGIRVSVDLAARLEIDAAASGGRVRTELPVALRGTREKTKLRGTLGGGGELLRLRTSGGGISIDPR